MSSFAVALIVFGCTFGSALLGMIVKLPDHHRDQDSKDVVKLVMGLIATISALVLSLLIASANSSFNVQRSELQSLTANLILLDRLLVSYGPEGKEVRDLLREAAVTTHGRLWSANEGQPMSLDDVTGFMNALRDLSPRNEAQRSLQSRIVLVGESLVQTRLLMLEQLEETISWPVVAVLVSWICVLFLGFGLFSRFNLIVTVALVLGAFSVSAALFLILELNTPYQGFLQISDAPLLKALAQLRR